MKQLPLYTAIASISLLSACSGSGSQDSVQGNQAPVVMVVDDITGVAGRSLVVDASSSYDPEGEYVDVSWAMTRSPNDSNPSLEIDEGSMTFTPDVAGVYALDVIVSDGALSARKTVSVLALNPSENNEDESNDSSTNQDNSGSKPNQGDDNQHNSDSNLDDSGNDSSSNEQEQGDNTSSNDPDSNTSDSSNNNDSLKSNTNCDIPTYASGQAYSIGDIVENNARYYYCDVAGWCSSSAAFAYSPGTGSAWDDAWNSVTLNEACAVSQEENDDNGQADNSDGSDSDNNGSGNNGSGDTDSSSNDQADNSDSSQTESWMENVDTTGWPKVLTNTNTPYDNSTDKVVGTYFVE